MCNMGCTVVFVSVLILAAISAALWLWSKAILDSMTTAWDVSKITLGTFNGIFIAPLLFFTLITIWRHKRWSGRLRVFSCLGQLMHAGVSLHTYRLLKVEFGHDVDFAPQSKELVVSTAIKGVVVSKYNHNNVGLHH